MSKKKLFIIRKYIYADSAFQALKKDKKTAADECWIDDDWKKNNMQEERNKIGFKKK